MGKSGVLSAAKKNSNSLCFQGGDAKNRPRRGRPQKPRKHGEFGSNSERLGWRGGNWKRGVLGC